MGAHRDDSFEYAQHIFWLRNKDKGYSRKKCPLPQNFLIPPVGDNLDIHVNFIHDPSNFVVGLYERKILIIYLLISLNECFECS